MRTRFIVAALVATLGATAALGAQQTQTGGNPARTGEMLGVTFMSSKPLASAARASYT